MEEDTNRLMLRRLFAHLTWADGRVAAALRQTPNPPADAVRIFAHLLGAEETWLSRIEQRESTLPVWPDLDAEACIRISADNAARLRSWLAAHAPDALAREISYRTSTGTPFTTRIDDILMHVCLHGAYHRGQVALLLRRAGLEPAVTDYVVFVRESEGGGL